MITIFYSNTTQNAKNKVYPYRMDADNLSQLRFALSNDYVCAEYKDNIRSNEKFLRSNCVGLDCDNDHSDDPSRWVTVERLREAFPDVPFAVHYSRSHLKEKHGKAARPRFHVLFPIEEVCDAEKYTELKKSAWSYFPYFDKNALDAARFFFGTENARVEVFGGSIMLDSFLEEQSRFDAFDEREPVFEGSRNTVMSRIAAALVKRLGDTEEAKTYFLAESTRCVPQLSDSELGTIWKSAQKFYREKVLPSPDYISPDDYALQSDEQVASARGSAPRWEVPVEFGQPEVPEFPLEALPDTVRGYVAALAESTQTPIDMCACAVLGVLALCTQGKYVIEGKPDWTEPLNLYVACVAEPSERKSAIVSAVMEPVSRYEREANERLAPQIEQSKIELSVLMEKKKRLEKKAAAGKASQEELCEIASELADFKLKKPLKLYTDDITTEKLVSALAEDGKTAIVSSEGGIFDVLSGAYSRHVNIDVFLKAFSGDTIRVDRIGRASESVLSPALTVLLTVQPAVISGIMSNKTFTGRGLTARFLYCVPRSLVGSRRYRTTPIPSAEKEAYNDIVYDILDEENKESELITLSAEADILLEAFSQRLEAEIPNAHSEVSQWAGKLAGAVLRLSGLLTRASGRRFEDFSYDDPKPLVVPKNIMENAIMLGEYFISHAKAAYSLMGADKVTADAEFLLNVIVKNRLTGFSRRDIMRKTSHFKVADDLLSALKLLRERGYLCEQTVDSNRKNKNSVYLVNPYVYDESCPEK